MVHILADHHPGQQASRGQAAINDSGGGRFSDDGLTVAAGVLRADVADDAELGWHDIQLLGDFLADQLQVLPAGAAGAGFRLMTLVDARQVGRQKMPVVLTAVKNTPS